MTLTEYLTNFMDIQDRYLAYSEFLAKYGNTWVYVNDVLVRIITEGCNETRLSTDKEEFTDIYSIKPFHPKIGTYFNPKDNIYLYIKKYADRQYKKSFCNSTYGVEVLSDKKGLAAKPKTYFTQNLTELIYLQPLILVDEFVYYKNLCLGKITKLGEFHTLKQYSFLQDKVEQACKMNLQLVTY